MIDPDNDMIMLISSLGNASGFTKWENNNKIIKFGPYPKSVGKYQIYLTLCDTNKDFLC